MAKHEDWSGQMVGGRYAVLRRLGLGGMGIVYQARDERLGADVVLKVPHAHMAADGEFAARFTQEVRSLVALAHSHVVRVLDLGDHNGRPFAVMQHLAGGSLRDKKMDPLRPASWRWLLHVAAALDFIHARGYVHRDVKPENILFDATGHVFLTDFGIVKALAHAEKKQRASALTGAGFVLGTPEYMAPEILAGQDYDGKADQYSLGVTAYEMVTGGVPPFKGDTAAVVFTKHLSEPPPPLRAAAPGLDPEAAAVIEKALAKSPANRHPTCAAFAKAFLSVLSQTGAVPTARQTSPGPGSTPPPLVAPSREDPLPAPTPRHPPSPAAPRRPRLPWIIATFVLVLAVASAAVAVLVVRNLPPVVTPGPKDADKDAGKKPPDEKTLPLPRELAELGWADPAAPLWCVTFSPDGKAVLAGGVGPPRHADAAGGPSRFFEAGHERPARAVAFAPDGTAATAGEDGKVILWDVPAGKPLASWAAHAGKAECLAWSPCGKYLATGGEDRAAAVWDASTQKEVRRLRGHAGPVTALAWSPDGRRLLSGGLDGSAILWDLESAERARTFALPGRHVPAVAFSPDGKLALAGASFPTRDDTDTEEGLHLFPLDADASPRVLPAPAHQIRAAAFTPDGLHLVTCGQDNKAMLWHLASGKSSTLAEHANWVTGVAVSPDGRRAVSVGTDGRLIAVNLPAPAAPVRVKPEPLTLTPPLRLDSSRLVGHARPTLAAAVTPDGKLFLTAGADLVVRLWDAAKDTESGKLAGHEAAVAGLAVSPDGKLAVSGDAAGTVFLWDIQKRQKVRSWKAHASDAFALAFSPKGGFIATGGGDGSVKLWDARTGEALREPRRGPAGAASSLLFLPDGKTLVSCSAGAIQFWPLPDGATRATAKHDGALRLALSPDGKTLASAGAGVRLWDTAGKPLGEIAGPGVVRGVAFTPDGKRLVTAGDDGALRIFDLASRKRLATFDAEAAVLTGLALTPDGKRAIAPLDSRATPPVHAPVVVSLPEPGPAIERPAPADPVFPPSELAPARKYEGHEEALTAAALSPDGKLALTAAGAEVHVWEAGTGKRVIALAGHKGAVCAAAFLPGAARVMTASKTGELMLWDVKTGKGRPLEHPAGNGEFEALAVSPDGKTALTGGTKLIQWDVEGLKALRGTGRLPDARRVTAAAMAPDGSHALYGNVAGNIYRWNLAAPKTETRYTGHAGPIRSIHFAPDGKRVVSAAGDEAHVWSADSAEGVSKFKAHAAPLRCARFVADGERVVSADEAGKMYLWGADKADGKKPLSGHAGGVSRLAAHGRTLLSAGADKAARVFDLPD